jgi:hypothetical protein
MRSLSPLKTEGIPERGANGLFKKRFRLLIRINTMALGLIPKFIIPSGWAMVFFPKLLSALADLLFCWLCHWATRYTVEADGPELVEIAGLVTSGKVKPHIQKTYPLRSAVDALASVEEGHSVGKVVMTVG